MSTGVRLKEDGIPQTDIAFTSIAVALEDGKCNSYIRSAWITYGGRKRGFLCPRCTRLKPHFPFIHYDILKWRSYGDPVSFSSPRKTGCPNLGTSYRVARHARMTCSGASSVRRPRPSPNASII